MIKVGIIGSTGYAGAELVRILLNHPDAKIVWYGSRSYVGQEYADIYGICLSSSTTSASMTTWTRWRMRRT